MNIINNILVLEDFLRSNLPEDVREGLKYQFEESIYINSKSDVEYILRLVSTECASKLISLEADTKIIIKPQPDLKAYIAYYESRGMCDHGEPATILVAINKAYCNLKQAEKMAQYMKAMGFGLHKEAD